MAGLIGISSANATYHVPTDTHSPARGLFILSGLARSLLMICHAGVGKDWWHEAVAKGNTLTPHGVSFCDCLFSVLHVQKRAVSGFLLHFLSKLPLGREVA